MILLVCVVCLLCSCATTGGGKSEGITSKDVDTALSINCAVGNPIACLLNVPFRVIDAVGFIGEVTGLKNKSSETEEPKSKIEELKEEPKTETEEPKREGIS